MSEQAAARSIDRAGGVMPVPVPRQEPRLAAVRHSPAEAYALAPVGRLRDTGTCMLLAIVTLGLYTLVWYAMVHREMRRHTGTGVGGPLALVLGLLFVVAPFVTSARVGELYARRGQQRPVSARTALWYVPGALLVVGPIVWFVKTNGALNSYWRSLGVR